MKINERLQQIGDLVEANSFCLDVGCDHALLDIYCALNKKNVKAIASDIKEGPLAMAKENVQKYDVSSKVKVVLGDGLSTYKDGVDTIILSGLGSSTIVSILNKGSKVLPNIDKLVISSNNDYCFLRKSICDLGFYISDEVMVYDKDKFYPIIVFRKGCKTYNEYELRYGPILLERMEDDFKGYLNNEKSKLFDIYRMLGVRHIGKKRKIKKLIKFIDTKLS